MRATLSCLSAGAVLGLLAAPVSGRLIENWPYERLLKESDLVVIARAEGTVDTKDRFDKSGWKVEFIGQETTFTVAAVLKGKHLAGKPLKVLHFRLPDGVLVENGPLLVTFHKESLPVTEIVAGKRIERKKGRVDYILFLRARPDGRYEPVSGQIDPVLSVRELQRPDSIRSELGRNAGPAPKEKKAGNDLERRCAKMLALQTAVQDATKKLHERRLTGSKVSRDSVRELAVDERAIIREARNTMSMLKAEGAGIAFTEVMHILQKDMRDVQRRLRRNDIGKKTQDILEENVATLREMIAALQRTLSATLD
jgi:hypothetical protein